MKTLEILTIELKALQTAAKGANLSEFERGYIEAFSFAVTSLTNGGPL